MPYLRIAALVRHYFFEHDLPTILDEGQEFSSLMHFLDLVPSPSSKENTDGHNLGLVEICDGLNLFSSDRCEIDVWCQGFFPAIARSVTMSRQLLLVNILWKQPSLLRVPKNYDVIFQVSFP